jgi:Tfp pilus assembly protein PilP
MHFAKTLVLGTLLAGVAPGVFAQAKPAASAPAKPAAQAPAKPAASAPAKPAAQAPAKPAVQAPAKRAVKTAAKPRVRSAAKKPAKPAAPAAASSAPVEAEAKVARRDPFESLVSRQKAAADLSSKLPPGKAGLQVSTLRLDGVVKAPNGMIAVVTNPQSRTYFLREGDQLYDGRVEKIAMDGVSFHETGKDAFGKPVERQVNKRIYASAGEQQ